MTSGEGRNAPASLNGLTHTGKTEFQPFGEFTRDGDYAQWDIKRESSPKPALAAGYSYKHKARSLAGQRGKSLFENRDQESFFADMILIYRGWA